MQRAALQRFTTDPSCLVLVMDKEGRVGLDLSMATHVFLMEPIWDKRWVPKEEGRG